MVEKSPLVTAKKQTSPPRKQKKQGTKRKIRRARNRRARKRLPKMRKRAMKRSPSRRNKPRRQLRAASPSFRAKRERLPLRATSERRNLSWSSGAAAAKV